MRLVERQAGGTRRGTPIRIVLAIVLALLLSGFAQAQSGDGSPAATLAEILADDSARQQLIQELRATAEQVPAAEAARELSFTQSLAQSAQSATQAVLTDISQSAQAITGLVNGSAAFSLAGFLGGMMGLAAVVVAALIALFLTRRLAAGAFTALSAWSASGGQPAGLVRSTLALVLAALADAAAVVAAWVVAYGVLTLVGALAGVTTLYALFFLNAFLFIELFRVALGALFAAGRPSLRLLPVSERVAAEWQGRIARLAHFLGYGLLLAVPLLVEVLVPATGRVLTVLIVLLAFLHVLRVVVQQRTRVSAQLVAAAGTSRSTVGSLGYSVLARVWHYLVLLYFGALAIVVVARPQDALPVMLSATVRMLVAIALGILLAALINQLLGRKRWAGSALVRRMPALAPRLDRFLPVVVKVLDVALALVVLGFILEAWGLFEFGAWVRSDSGSALISTVITVALILATAQGLWIALASYIEYRLDPESGTREASAREKTLLTIFRNALLVALVIMTLMIVLAELGINIGPLIAGAGVLGLAIGFGAQKLVQDIITGIFIQMENAINTGDIVTAGGITGEAEKLTVRSLALRDLSGTYHIIPFSSVDTVSNFMRDFGFHVGVYRVGYREDPDQVIAQLQNAFAELKQDAVQAANILSHELEVHGVTELADSSVKVRIRIMTTAGTQWGVGRAYNQLVKTHLQAAGIEIPYPQTRVYLASDSLDGNSAAPDRLDQPEG